MSNIKATLIDHMGSDITTVNSARVSFGKTSQPVAWMEYDYEDGSRCGDLIAVLDERDTKLVKYLAKHKHLSPFGHAFASFHVKAPIFVARQLVKHKFLRWNEISRRYVDDEPEFYVPDVWRGRSADKKQGSDGVVEVSYDFPWVDYGSWGNYKQYLETCEAGYKSLLEKGVAPEQARMVLPQSTMTEWYWSGSLDAFASMCQLRCKPDTQYESRVVADQISEIMQGLFPVSWAALMKGRPMTKFNEAQIKHLESLIVYKTDNPADGFDVNGNVLGNVEGNVEGDVWGNVEGDVEGDVWGNVLGDVLGDVLGSIGETEDDSE